MLLKKQMVWKVPFQFAPSVEKVPFQFAPSVEKAPFQFTPSAEIKREIPFSSSILHK